MVDTYLGHEMLATRLGPQSFNERCDTSQHLASNFNRCRAVMFVCQEEFDQRQQLADRRLSPDDRR